ncbi:MAG: NAD-dependent epimerase/dehydratase family protein, partial [bacterium]
MRVLITGHKGYIGSVMVPMFLSEGYTVIGLDSDLYEACTYGEPLTEVPQIRKDIRDVTLDDLEGFDAIIHLAALSNDPLGDLNPNLTYEINYHASVHLARLAKLAGIKRFIFSSSCSTYGASSDHFIDEGAELNPVTPYGRSKVLVEKALLKMADAKFSPTFLRNATAYGVSPRLRFDLVLNNLVAWATTTGKIFLKSDGSPWRPIVHIEDIARAFLAVLQAPRGVIHCRAFNVGRNEDNYRIRDLAEIVKNTVPGCRISFAKDAGPDTRNYRVDCSKITRSLPNFKPGWNAKRGAQELYDAYIKHGLCLKDFEGQRFKRIEHIKHLLKIGRLDQTLRI